MSLTNSFVEMLVQQARNVLNNMNDLKWIAGDKGKDRGALIERFTANTHSFNVYTYANVEVAQIPEVQAFKEKLSLFNKEFNIARFDFQGEVDKDRVQTIYEEVVKAYNDMVISLGFDKEIADF